MPSHDAILACPKGLEAASFGQRRSDRGFSFDDEPIAS
jgi:hypothetical protein